MNGDIVTLGAETFVPWAYGAAPARIIKQRRAAGWSIVAIEQDVAAHDYRTFTPEKPTLFIFGNEVRGLSRRLLKTCDEVIEIPMRGKKESLNVATSVGVILFSAIR